MEALQIISVLFFIISLAIYFLKGPASSLAYRLIVGAASFISIFLFIFFVVANHFTGRGITSSVMYYLQFGFRDAGLSPYFGFIFLITLVLLLSIFFCVWLVAKKPKKGGIVHKNFALVMVFLLLSIALSPVTNSFGEYFKINVMEADIETNSDFLNYYSPPRLTPLGEKKNLIFIYAESLERTYFDENIFPGLIEDLREIEEKSISFTNIDQDEISHHTIGAIVATQCGFPLISSSHSNTMSGMDYYLGAAECISDLLSEEGFFLSFFGGANINFSGKGKFFETHKFDSVNGFTEMIPLVEDSDYRNPWGFFDDTVLDLAYKDFEKLAKTKQNFGLFVLTLDTHHPNGFKSKSCEDIKYSELDNPILDAVKCSDVLISEFVKKVRNSGLSDDTVIVISSDHLAMSNSAMDFLENANRKALFLINLPKNSEVSKIENAGLTLDIGSTILPYLGYSGEIGFGRDIANISNPESRRAELLLKLPDFYSILIKFWDFPVLKNEINIDFARKKFFIDNRKFSIPALISFDENFKTNIYFKNELPEDYLLSETIADEEIERFLLIDRCKLLEKNHLSEGFCLKTNNPNVDIIDLNEKKTYSKEEIHSMLGF